MLDRALAVTITPQEQTVLQFLESGGVGSITNEYQAKCLKKGLDDRLDLLPEAEALFNELDTKLKADCRTIDPRKRIAPNSDLGYVSNITLIPPLQNHLNSPLLPKVAR